MLEPLWRRYHALRRRIRRIERREAHALRRWLEDTENFLHLSVLFVVPLVIGTITWLSNVSAAVSFLIYPPLASGSYMLFSDPNGPYSKPWKFVGGISAGAICGLVALLLSTRFLYTVQPGSVGVNAGAAALGILFTIVVTWGLELEVPTAFSTALLVLVMGSGELTYVAGIVVSSGLVAGVFAAWRRYFYRERSRYLFRSTRSDDHVLVPVDDDTSESVALFAARLATAHESGELVLMRTVSEAAITAAEAEIASADAAPGTGDVIDADETVDADDASSPETTAQAEEQVTARALRLLDELRNRITGTVAVSCEYVVVVDDGATGGTVLRTAAEEGCDLVCAPCEIEDGGLAPHLRTLLTGDVDTIVFRPSRDRTEWRRILVMVRTSGEIANAMMEFAQRLVPPDGTISACSVVSTERERRRAEIVLEDVVDSLSVPVETRIGRGSIERFLEGNAGYYDVVFVGASTDRNSVSRLVSTPTHERIHDLDCDLAIVHRG